jgi:phage gp29-like protein
MSVLADFILLGHEKVGSFALSSDKTDIFAVALGTILKVIAEALNRFAVPRLWVLNGWDPTKCPKIDHGDIEDQDLAVLAQFLTALNGMGVRLFPDDELEAHLRQLAHIPEKSEAAKRQQEEEDAAQQGGEEDDIRFTDDGGNPLDAGGGDQGAGGPAPGS